MADALVAVVTGEPRHRAGGVPPPAASLGHVVVPTARDPGKAGSAADRLGVGHHRLDVDDASVAEPAGHPTGKYGRVARW